MADELRTASGIEADLIPGKEGVFDVIVDGNLIFSKDQTGRFPRPDELSALLKNKPV